MKTRREKSWSLDQKYAESIGAEPWFAHLSAQETTTSHPKPFFHFAGKFLDEAFMVVQEKRSHPWLSANWQ